MARFFFFTDIESISNQTSADAFGPVLGSTDTQFRLTSIHPPASGKSPAAFAVCDGLVCAQTDDQGTLTLILKPSVQPPFDFPAISYILYKGIDPNSLLASGGAIDTALETTNDLVKAIKQAWELEANGNTGSPTRACLGLHLNPTDYPAADNPVRFADSQPLDSFFYKGDPKVQLPFVRGGWRLGNFSSSSPSGIEIVVERIGRRPKIALARKLENILSVAPLPTSADASALFHHWDAKDAILDFVDPCAFWGSFFAATLRVWNEANSEFDKLSGTAIYDTVLRGTAAGAAKFANRNRAYIDIRNEHGNSLNYYQADGTNIQLTLDAAADIDTCEVNYYGSGWPSFAVDNSNLPTGTTGNKIDVRFALPRTANTRPLIYISAGYRDEFKVLKDARRFFDHQRRGGVPYLEEAAIMIPLVEDAGTKVTSSYQKLFSFKRPLIEAGLPVLTSDPANLAPNYAGLLDQVFPVLPEDVFSVIGKPTVIRTFGEERYVTRPTAEYGGFVARLTVAQDASNQYWILTPHAYYRWPGATGMSDLAEGSPSITSSSKSNFLAEFVKRKAPRELLQVAVTPPPDASSQSPVEIVIPGSNRKVAHGDAGRAFERTVILCLSRTDMTQLSLDLAPTSPLPGSVFLLPGEAETFEAGLHSYTRAAIAVTYLKTNPSLARETVPTSLEIYRDADI